PDRVVRRDDRKRRGPAGSVESVSLRGKPIGAAGTVESPARTGRCVFPQLLFRMACRKEQTAGDAGRATDSASRTSPSLLLGSVGACRRSLARASKFTQKFKPPPADTSESVNCCSGGFHAGVSD